MQIGTLSLASLARLREGVRRERISSWDQGPVAAAESHPWLGRRHQQCGAGEQEECMIIRCGKISNG